MNQKVSILVPVFNRKDLIPATLESALNQTYGNIEIVVVDNASTDGTWEIIKSYARQDSRIKNFRNDCNIGPVRNWRRCFDLAEGEYGKVLFSDDLMEHEFLEKTLPYLHDSDVGFVFSAAKVGASKKDSVTFYVWRKGSGVFPSISFIEDALFGEKIPFSPGAALFRLKDLKKNLVSDIPSPTYNDFESHGAGSDFLLYLLACIDHPKVAFIADPLVFFCNHDDSITTGNYDMVMERYYQAKLYFAGLMNNRQWLLNLLLHRWIGSLSSGKFVPFSSFTAQYCHNKVSFTYEQWLKGGYFLLKRKLKK